jgi:hypothetical protein
MPRRFVLRFFVPHPETGPQALQGNARHSKGKADMPVAAIPLDAQAVTGD